MDKRRNNNEEGKVAMSHVFDPKIYRIIHGAVLPAYE
jgi:hypothetical protein